GQFLCTFTYSNDRSKLLVILDDLGTEVKAREEQRSIIRGIAHDLRGALTSVLLGIDVATADNESAAATFGQITEEVHRTLSIFESFLAIERAVLGKLVLLKEPVDLLQTLDAAIDLTATEYSADVVADIEPAASLEITGDP